MLRQLPEYECHRRVRAARIAELMLDNDENSRMGTALLELPGSLMPFRINRDWFDKWEPEIGGYFVLGEDGIPGYIAREAFEQGYTLLSDLLTEPLAGQRWTQADRNALASRMLDAAAKAPQAEVVRQLPPVKKRHATTCPAEYTEGATCTCSASPWRIA